MKKRCPTSIGHRRRCQLGKTTWLKSFGDKGQCWCVCAVNKNGNLVSGLLHALPRCQSLPECFEKLMCLRSAIEKQRLLMFSQEKKKVRIHKGNQIFDSLLIKTLSHLCKMVLPLSLWRYWLWWLLIKIQTFIYLLRRLWYLTAIMPIGVQMKVAPLSVLSVKQHDQKGHPCSILDIGHNESVLCVTHEHRG